MKVQFCSDLKCTEIIATIVLHIQWLLSKYVPTFAAIHGHELNYEKTLFRSDGNRDGPRHSVDYKSIPSRLWKIRHIITFFLFIHPNLIVVTGASHEHHGFSNSRKLNSLVDNCSSEQQRKYHSSGLLTICEGNTPVISGLHLQRVGNAENVSCHKNWTLFCWFQQQH